jgi:ABC-type multidrug transport system fused ATPase/permease subunit
MAIEPDKTTAAAAGVEFSSAGSEALSEQAALDPRFWEAQYAKRARPRHSEWWVFFHFLAWVKPYWTKMALVLFTSVLGVTVSLVPPWLSKYLVDQAFPQRDWNVFWSIFVAYCAMDVFWRISDTCNNILNYYVNIRVSLNLKKHFFDHLQRLSMTFLHGRPIGEHMFRANADIDAIMRMITVLVPAAIRALYEFGLILLLTSFLDWKVTLLVLLYAVPYTWFAHWIATIQRHLDRDSRRRWQRYDAGVQEGVAGVMVVKTFARHRYEIYRYTHLFIDGWRQWSKFWWVARLREHTVGSFLPWIKEQLLRIWFFCMVIRGELTYGSVFPILSYMGRLTNPIQQIVDYIQEIRVALIPAERILETLEVLPAVIDQPGAKRMPPLQGGVRFEQVSFNYEDQRPVLHDVDFAALPGQKIGIVGHSGSGKSTVVNLLLRLYPPTQGRILLDGIDLADVRMNSYQHQIGLVLQDTYLFCGTIRENLLFSNLHATEEDLMRATKQAEIHDWITTQPEGFDTDLSEGTRLSLGQKQRLGLARALLRDPKVLVMDEPTSSLDSPTEQKLLVTFREACRGRTTIWVSHRLNTVVDADLILVVHEGRIAERGTHDELLAQNGHYKGLWDLYFGLAAPAGTTSGS